MLNSVTFWYFTLSDMGAGSGGWPSRSTVLCVPLKTRMSRSRLELRRSEYISTLRSSRLASPELMKTVTGAVDWDAMLKTFPVASKPMSCAARSEHARQFAADARGQADDLSASQAQPAQPLGTTQVGKHVAARIRIFLHTCNLGLPCQ